MLMPGVGLEPTRGRPHRILNPARLPIPPSWRNQSVLMPHWDEVNEMCLLGGLILMPVEDKAMRKVIRGNPDGHLVPHHNPDLKALHFTTALGGDRRAVLEHDFIHATPRHVRDLTFQLN